MIFDDHDIRDDIGVFTADYDTHTLENYLARRGYEVVQVCVCVCVCVCVNSGNVRFCTNKRVFMLCRVCVFVETKKKVCMCVCVCVCV